MAHPYPVMCSSLNNFQHKFSFSHIIIHTRLLLALLFVFRHSLCRRYVQQRLEHPLPLRTAPKILLQVLSILPQRALRSACLCPVHKLLVLEQCCSTIPPAALCSPLSHVRCTNAPLYCFTRFHLPPFFLECLSLPSYHLDKIRIFSEVEKLKIEITHLDQFLHPTFLFGIRRKPRRIQLQQYAVSSFSEKFSRSRSNFLDSRSRIIREISRFPVSW